jgi:hypothetical protein
MKPQDLFPAELAAAQRELAECHPFEPLTMDGLGLTEDEKEEESERYWYWSDDDYAAMVCQKRWGPL